MTLLGLLLLAASLATPPNDYGREATSTLSQATRSDSAGGSSEVLDGSSGGVRSAEPRCTDQECDMGCTDPACDTGGLAVWALAGGEDDAGWSGDREPGGLDVPSPVVGAVLDATPTPEARPAAVSDSATEAVPEALFRAGYLDAGGPVELLDHMWIDVIWCESRWTLDPGNPDYVGPAQFHPDTWARARRSPDANPYDWYEQGWAVGHWIILIGSENAGTNGGWPVCYWRGITW